MPKEESKTTKPESAPSKEEKHEVTKNDTKKDSPAEPAKAVDKIAAVTTEEASKEAPEQQPKK